MNQNNERDLIMNKSWCRYNSDIAFSTARSFEILQCIYIYIYIYMYMLE